MDSSKLMENNLFQIYKNYTKSYLGHKYGKILSIEGLHPSMSHFLLGYRKNIYIINTGLTFNFLTKALYVILLITKTKKKSNGIRGPHLLIINTNPEWDCMLSNLVNNTKNISYCNFKWVGGTLTNWNQVSKSIRTFAKFSERFDNFLTMNKILFPKYNKMKKCFGGFIRRDGPYVDVSLKKKPDILFVLNPNENRNVIEEANRLNIPVIALTDSNTPISGINYPIPVNKNSVEFLLLSFFWIIRIFKNGILEILN